MTTREDTDEEVEENLLPSEVSTTKAPQFTDMVEGPERRHSMAATPTANAAATGPGVGNEVSICRPALNIQQRCNNYHYDPGVEPGTSDKLRKAAKDSIQCSGSCVKNAIASKLPILSWLPSYSVRESLLGDIIAGVTVAIMHIPQGMAYALLAGLPPITGIYMAFFPILVYVLLGTSRHNSMGTFAVVCLMTGKVVGDLAGKEPDVSDLLRNANITDDTIVDLSDTGYYTPNQVAAIVAFMVGVWEILLGLLQLGVLCVFLSDMLVSGFTTGAAVHVFTSQVKYLFGIHVVRYSGPLKIIYTYRDIFSQLLSANPAAMVVSLITIAVLGFNNEIIKPWVRKKTIIPIPIELMAVIAGTVASYFGNLHDNYDIRTVGEIPTGLPEPTLPPLDLLPRVAVDSLIICIVAYTVSFSMAKIFAKKHDYTVDATQELYSQGLSNVFGSFFGCAPIAASLSRSLIQEAVGGVTQITSLIACLLLVFVLLFVGPVFETLPNCVLSSIIVVALKGMFLQFNDLKNIWSISRADASIWIVSFLGVVIIDIDYGLLLGVITSLLVLLARSQKPSAIRLGHVPNTDLYLDVDKYSAAIEIPSFSIFQFNGPLHFANVEYFRQKLFTVTDLTPSTIISTRKHIKQCSSEPDLTLQSNNGEHINVVVPQECSGDTITEKQVNGVAKLIKSKMQSIQAKQVSLSIPNVKYLIIEMSGVSYVDSTGGKVISQLHKDYSDAGINLYLASVSESVLQCLEKCGTLKTLTREHIFHSVHDAMTILTKDSFVFDDCTRL